MNAFDVCRTHSCKDEEQSRICHRRRLQMQNTFSWWVHVSQIWPKPSVILPCMDLADPEYADVLQETDVGMQKPRIQRPSWDGQVGPIRGHSWDNWLRYFLLSTGEFGRSSRVFQTFW